MAVVYDTTDRRGAEDTLLTEATTDALTGLLNRRGWLQGAQELLRVWDLKEPVTVAMIDLDHFKAFNDARGHVAGDALLTRFGAALRAELRGRDLVSRWGGEEFLVLMPETSTDSAILVMERLREAVARLRVRINDESLSVTVSLGLSELRADENYSSAINRADVALLRAKRNGRNRYELAD